MRGIQCLMTTEATSLTIARTCYRCGVEFRSRQRDRVCTTCRKPKAPREILNRDLTMREKQIIEQVRFGKLNKEIAYELHLCEGTVKEYMNRIFRKLEVKNRTELAVWALMQQIAA